MAVATAEASDWAAALALPPPHTCEEVSVQVVIEIVMFGYRSLRTPVRVDAMCKTMWGAERNPYSG